MKIGLFGGTFNPYHNGHFGIVEYVRNHLGLDRVYLIPSSTPPHKPDSNLAPAELRFEMVKKSIKNCPGLYVSNRELIRQGPSFTIDTIYEFQNDFPTDTPFFLLLGSDAFFDIETWKNQEKIFHNISIIVMIRGSKETLEDITAFVDEQLSKRYTFNRKSGEFTHPVKKKIIITNVPKIDISSTMIRTRVKNNLSIQKLVPEPVDELIRSKELYR